MKRIVKCFGALAFLLISGTKSFAQEDSTYAQKLGYPKDAKVVILHVDDVGMSFDSNEGAINAITQGVANSCSVMMPCSWVPAFVHYLKQHPQIDAGLHLTLTSEWKEYRWPPVAGVKAVPGLVDQEGALWPSVEEVVKHASADEVEMEIRAQVEKALKMGFLPTHLDSHMGTLFGSLPFIQRYLKVGMEYKIPVMFPAGHASLIQVHNKLDPQLVQGIRLLGKQLWASGLPVLDDLYNASYGWEPDAITAADTKKLQAFKTAHYIEALKEIKPGLTMIIMHCTQPSPIFKNISESGPTRQGDLLAMIDPALKKALEEQKIVLVTWRELMERRKGR